RSIECPKHTRFVVVLSRLPAPTLFPYTTLFRSGSATPRRAVRDASRNPVRDGPASGDPPPDARRLHREPEGRPLMTEFSKIEWRSEEHTSELQSRENLVCRLLLEKKKS